MIKKYLIGLTIVFLALITLTFLESAITGNLVKEDQNIVINFPRSADFKNSKAGGVVFEFNFPADSFKVNNKTADILMLLDSKTIPGLKLGYDTKEKKLKGGLPVISSREVEILDNKAHKILYTFDQQKGIQSIHLDGRLLANGKYTGKREDSDITGFSVMNGWIYIDSPLSVDTQFNPLQEKTCGCGN